MTKSARARDTLEFRQKALRLVEGGQSIAAAARTLGALDQTLFNWVKAQREGKLKGDDGQAKVSVEPYVRGDGQVVRAWNASFRIICASIAGSAEFGINREWRYILTRYSRGEAMAA